MSGTTCRGCAGADVVRVLDLGALPGSDHFPPIDDPSADERWPLELWFCNDCSLVQLGPVVPQLPRPALALESETSRRHADASVRDLLEGDAASPVRCVLEFASHHGGSWLDALWRAGCRVVGPTERADLVVDVHALAHEKEVADAIVQRARRLAPEGILVLEFHHLLPLVLGSQFDTVRHGHWSYLSLGALRNIVARHGLRVVSARATSVFGGSLQVHIVHEASAHRGHPSVDAIVADESAAGLYDAGRLQDLQAATRRSAASLRRYLEEQRARHRTVLGYGAPSKATVLLGVSDVGAELLPFTVDASVSKHSRRIPGCGVPIRSVQDLRDARPEIVLVLSWDIVEEVMQQLESGGGWGAEYVIPLPDPHAVGG